MTRIGKLYRQTAVVLLNLLVLFLFLDCGANLLLGLRQRGLATRLSHLDAYANHEWGETLWRESNRRSRRYHPYTIWRHAPQDGETINFDARGIRITPGADCREDAFELLALGGSTMWGYGSPDWGSVAAHLQSQLDAAIDGPVCVVNYGQPAYTTTQSVIELLLALQAGERPHAVVSYEGINDIFAAYQSGQAGVHQNLEQIRLRFERPAPLLVEALLGSDWMKLVTRLLTRVGAGRGPLTYENLGLDAGELAESVVAAYLVNYSVVEALSRRYGFAFSFYWQPYVGTKRPLSEAERALTGWGGTARRRLFEEVYARIERLAAEGRYPELYYIADAFDGIAERVYIDPYHVTPLGNEIVARRIASVVKAQLATRQAHPVRSPNG